VVGLDDRELAAALETARRGEEIGFAELWRQLQPGLLRYLWVIVGDAAEDVASETWLQVARDLRGFAGDGTAFRVGLYRGARHRAIDDRRRAARRPEEPHQAPVDDTVPSDHDPFAEATDRAELAWALRMIGSLPADQAEAVLLRVVAGLDVGQTAQVLGKRAGAVRVAAMRGLRRLARHPEVRALRPDRTDPAGEPTMEPVPQEGV
jgi:RNA polymerase sigma-70 factor (ECF subfamily)